MKVGDLHPGRTIVAVTLTFALAGTFETAADLSSVALDLDVTQLLKSDLGFSASEIERVSRGEVILRGLDVDDESVGIAAIALIGVPPAFFLESARRIEEFKKTPEVQQIARFSTPPAVADMGLLTLDKADLDEAHRCRPGDCALKLDDGGIARVGSVPVGGDVLSAYRTYLAGYAAAYMRHGNGSLITYHDHSRPQALSWHFEKILKASPYIGRNWPDLHSALASFSGKLPDGLQDFTYWSKEKVGPRASVTLTHVITRPPDRGIAVIASKQIYASHYTNASLGLTVMVDRGTPAEPRTLLIYVNRTRVDALGGVLGGLKRPIVRSRAKSGAERMIENLRTKLQTEFRDSR